MEELATIVYLNSCGFSLSILGTACKKASGDELVDALFIRTESSTCDVVYWMNRWMGLVVVTAIARLLKGAVQKPMCSLSLPVLHIRAETVPLSEWTPGRILNLLLNKSSQIDPFVKLICFCPRIADPAFVIEFLCDLLGLSDVVDQQNTSDFTFMTLSLSIRKNMEPSLCSSTVVNGRGFHLLVGFFRMLQTLAFRALMHLSNNIITVIRSKRRTRRHKNETSLSSRRCTTLILQNGSGTKFLTRKYLSTTNPKVGNWQEPLINVRREPMT